MDEDFVVFLETDDKVHLTEFNLVVGGDLVLFLESFVENITH